MTNRPTLILLPAMPCGAEFYAAQVDALSDVADCRVMVEDAPSLEESAAHILAAAPRRFLLAGTAYGGRLALEVALAAPERIAGLWLMNCNPGAHGDPAGALRLTAGVRAEGIEAMLEEWAPVIVAEDDEASRDRFRAMARASGADRFARQHDALVGRADRWGDLGRITVPTLLMWGEDDRFVPVAIGRRMVSLMPMARFIALAGCRHFPPLERPRETIAAARRWIGGT
ncbi:MAG: alpha/beta fold hydrolase [Alphaproteobacteria bacterium]|nr:alpha/beta fold hydrolase [Alphaproteobacteria bacterium]MCW5744547.1 alpha/beta fold hydrolase [Alphaproteobacteria bacterium]